jgi:hypothetical protein
MKRLGEKRTGGAGEKERVKGGNGEGGKGKNKGR